VVRRRLARLLSRSGHSSRRGLRRGRVRNGVSKVQFANDDGVGFDCTSLRNRVERRRAADLAERPSARTADERLGIIQAANERGGGRGGLLIAEDNRRVAEDAAAASAPQRRVAKTAAKGLVVEIEQ